MAKMAKFWVKVWGSKAWADEMNAWADAQTEVALLKQFLADYAEQPVKGNVPFLRRKVKEFVANVRAARMEVAKKRKQEQPPEPEAEVEIAVEPEEVKSATLDQLAELGRDFQGMVSALRDQVDGRMAELRKQLQTTEAGLTGLRKEVGNSATQVQLIDARDKWARAVRESIEATLEGKKRDQFLEWWDKVVGFLNKPVEVAR